MKKNQIIQLLGVVFVLGALLFFLENGEEQKFQHQEQELLAGIDGNKAVKVVVEQAGQKSEIARTDNGWTVASRFGYQASPEKVNSLLIKAFGLTSTQKIPTKSEKFGSLGVDDANFKGKLSFVDDQGKELGALLLGENRKERKVPGSYGSAVGQFVRRTGTDAVYLIAEPFTVTATSESWLEKEIINVSQLKMRVVTLDKDLKLIRSNLADPSSKLMIEPAFTAGEELEESIVSQVAGAMENLNLNDVIKNDANDEKVKSLTFDRTYIAETSSGVIYTVSTAEKDSKGYLKINVEYSPELSKKIEEETAAKNTERKKQFDEEQAKKKEENKDGAKKEEATETKFEELKADLITKEQAEKLNQKLSPWIYEVATFQTDKFRKPRSEFVKKKEEAKKDAQEPATEEDSKE
jgi:hypothetical protein